jgi:NADP-dependent 3-hydroxy acid dehydrogenase YdfG
MHGILKNNVEIIQQVQLDTNQTTDEKVTIEEKVKELIGSNHYDDNLTPEKNIRNAITNEVFPTGNDISLKGASFPEDISTPIKLWECHVKEGHISYKETIVFITGASNGIGFATAERCAKEGYTVFATARFPERNPQLSALADQYQNLFIKKLDVTDSEENINELINAIGTIDILINNAAVGIVGPAESCSLEQIQLIINTNVLGVVKVTNAVLPGMREQNSGRIITISSVVGLLPALGQSFYSGSKAMIEHYTAHLKNDLEKANYNIIVANVHPGPVTTNFEASAFVGDRFTGRENPYPQMDNDIDGWRSFLKNEGRPVSETVDTILRVMQEEKPVFWNPTESRVQDNFAETYCDPTGEKFSKGPSFPPQSQQSQSTGFNNVEKESGLGIHSLEKL